jgi:hypothetical protein
LNLNNKHYRQQGFCVRRAKVQNSTAVFQLNISNKTSFCTSISRPNAKPQTVSTHPKRPTRPTINRQKKRTKMPTLSKIKEVFCQHTCRYKNTSFNFAQPLPSPPTTPKSKNSKKTCITKSFS